MPTSPEGEFQNTTRFLAAWLELLDLRSRQPSLLRAIIHRDLRLDPNHLTGLHQTGIARRKVTLGPTHHLSGSREVLNDQNSEGLTRFGHLMLHTADHACEGETRTLVPADVNVIQQPKTLVSFVIHHSPKLIERMTSDVETEKFLLML